MMHRKTRTSANAKHAAKNTNSTTLFTVSSALKCSPDQNKSGNIRSHTLDLAFRNCLFVTLILVFCCFSILKHIVISSHCYIMWKNTFKTVKWLNKSVRKHVHFPANLKKKKREREREREKGKWQFYIYKHGKLFAA